MIEIIAVIFSLLSVLYTVSKNIWGWIHGIIGIIFYGIIFYQENLYSNLLLQVIFLFQSFYGIWNWKSNTNSKGEMKVEKMNLGEIICSGLSVMLLTITLEAILNSTLIDAVTTSLSIVAFYLLSRRKIENWIFWIIADIIYVYLFFTTVHQGQKLYLSSALYALFLLLCIIGYRKWTKKIS